MEEVAELRRRSLDSTRRRGPVNPIGSIGFLRPTRRHEEENRRFLERVRDEPRLRREYSASLLLQLVVVGALLLACAGLIVQSALLMRQLQIPNLSILGWIVPLLVALLALAVLRRFLRILSDYRSLRR